MNALRPSRRLVRRPSRRDACTRASHTRARTHRNTHHDCKTVHHACAARSAARPRACARAAAKPHIRLTHDADSTHRTTTRHTAARRNPPRHTATHRHNDSFRHCRNNEHSTRPNIYRCCRHCALCLHLPVGFGFVRIHHTSRTICLKFELRYFFDRFSTNTK